MPDRQTVILSKIERTALKSVLAECELARERLQNAAHMHQASENQRSEVVRDLLAVYGFGPDDELTTSPKELHEGGLVHLERKTPPAPPKEKEEEKDDGTKIENAARG